MKPESNINIAVPSIRPIPMSRLQPMEILQMTTTNVDVVKPGSVVMVMGLSSLEDNEFAIVLPEEFWMKKASKSAIEKYEKYSKSRPQLPLFQMNGDFCWNFQFRQTTETRKMGSLLDNRTQDAFLLLLGYFTYRDGSRYYKVFHRSCLFLIELLDRMEKPQERQGLSEMSQVAVSLRLWSEAQKKDKKPT